MQQFAHSFVPTAPPMMFTKSFAETAASYLQHGGNDRHLQPIIDHFGDRNLATIFPFDVKQMAIDLYPTQSNATRNRQALTPARAVINHGYERGWCNLIRIKKLKEEKPLPKTPASPIWMHAFIRRCDRDGLPHLAALVLFMAQTAARVSEAVNLKWKDVDLPARRALILKTKTGTNSIRHLTDEQVSRLRAMRGSEPDDAPVFRYRNRHAVNERIKAVCRRAEISYKSSHLCGRHTFATTAMDLGMDVRTAMEAGDWRTASIFLGIYVHPRQNSGRIVADRFNAYQFEGNV
jgi:integrase